MMMKYSLFSVILSISCLLLNKHSLISAQQHNLVDVSRFTQLLSNHLLFDHFDKASTQLSRKISFQFRDAIHVHVKKLKKKNSELDNSDALKTMQQTLPPPVDVQILKRQLKGAVGSFVEDKLPTILTNRYSMSTLQVQLDQFINQYCPITIQEQRRMVDSNCLVGYREHFLSKIHKFTLAELQSNLVQVNEQDLPRLFEKTRAQISGILIHFNQHTMDKDTHTLELKIKTNSKQQQVGFDNTKVRNWITYDMMQDFISTVNHTDLEDEKTSIQHFIDLSI